VVEAHYLVVKVGKRLKWLELLGKDGLLKSEATALEIETAIGD
jgi:hypothetical protein